MIASIDIENFKSYSKTSVALSPVTFLVGLNGSGKTNFLELLKFIAWEARGGQLDALQQIAGPGHSEIRALKVSDFVRRGEQQFSFALRLENGEKYRLEQTVSVHEREGVVRMLITKEMLFNKDDKQVYRVDGAPQAAYHLLSSISNLPPQFNRYNTQGSAKYVKDALSRIVFLEPNFSKMSRYVAISRGSTLESDGANLSAVAFRLCNDPALKESFFDMVRTLPEREFKEIRFSKAELLDEVMLVCMEDNDNLVPLQLLSQGTLRMLLVGAALLTLPKGTLLVLEEIDTGIHPSRVAHLIKRVYEIAKERGIQVLATTHNPQVLNTLPENEVANVVLCYRDNDCGCSRLTRFGDIPEYVELLMRDDLGGLMVSEAVETVLRHPKTSEQRKDIGRDFLTRLKALPQHDSGSAK